MDFNIQYEKWLNDCLEEFNKRFCETRVFHTDDSKNTYSSNLVEFSQNGHAYPHGIGGTNYIENAVTPWFESPHFME